MRLKPLRTSLRSKKLLKMFSRCCMRAKHYGLRVNQFALLGNHLHLIVEVENRRDLRRGMRSFGGRLGKAIRQLEGGCGAVFRDRFHAHVLKTPQEYLAALKYVLLNRAKHAGRAPDVDAYSSAPYFREWRLIVDVKDVARMMRESVAEAALFLDAARSWLGRGGWKRAHRGAAT